MHVVNSNMHTVNSNLKYLIVTCKQLIVVCKGKFELFTFPCVPPTASPCCHSSDFWPALEFQEIARDSLLLHIQPLVFPDLTSGRWWPFADASCLSPLKLLEAVALLASMSPYLQVFIHLSNAYIISNVPLPFFESLYLELHTWPSFCHHVFLACPIWAAKPFLWFQMYYM
jgi:hypothetical protein